MAVTVQQVYDMAMALIDEVSETGSLAVENPGYYQKKSTSFLTALQTELLPLDTDPVVISNLSDTLLLSDRISLLVLPYGLAAHLLISENPSMASFFNNRYEELKRKIPVEQVAIEDVYDVLGGMI